MYYGTNCIVAVACLLSISLSRARFARVLNHIRETFLNWLGTQMIERCGVARVPPFFLRVHIKALCMLFATVYRFQVMS